MSLEVNFLKEVSHAIDLTAQQMTSRTQILTAKQQKSLKLKKSMVARIIDGDNDKVTKIELENNDKVNN